MFMYIVIISLHYFTYATVQLKLKIKKSLLLTPQVQFLSVRRPVLVI